MDDAILDSYGLDADRENEQNTAITDTKESSLGVGDELGVDEEVVGRTRRKVAKLDAERLTSNKGIPYIQNKISRKKNLFRGRGHEKHDLNKLLYEYQMWAHSLFPKARFDDFIDLAKSAGAKPAMKHKRRDWVREEKDGLSQFNVPVPASFDKKIEGDKAGDNDVNVLDENVSEQMPGQQNNNNNNDDDDDDDDDGDDDLFVTTSRRELMPDNFEGSLFDVPGESNKYDNNAANNNDNGDIPNDDEMEELMNTRQEKSELEREEERLQDEFGF